VAQNWRALQTAVNALAPRCAGGVKGGEAAERREGMASTPSGCRALCAVRRSSHLAVVGYFQKNPIQEPAGA
jgi:hypothetical protein